MYAKLIRNILMFCGLLVLQLLVIDNIGFGAYIHPCIYVLFILLLPFDISRQRLMINGFIIGMIVDIFNGTPGLNAAATVLMAYLRPSVISLTTRKSDIEGKEYPSVSEMGLQWFIIYSLILLLAHNLLLFILEAFSIKLIGIVLLEVICSVPVSLLAILLIIYIFDLKKIN